MKLNLSTPILIQNLLVNKQKSAIFHMKILYLRRRIYRFCCEPIFVQTVKITEPIINLSGGEFFFKSRFSNGHFRKFRQEVTFRGALHFEYWLKVYHQKAKPIDFSSHQPRLMPQVIILKFWQKFPVKLFLGRQTNNFSFLKPSLLPSDVYPLWLIMCHFR